MICTYYQLFYANLKFVFLYSKTNKTIATFLIGKK